MEKRYHDLFALYLKKSPTVFWNTVHETGVGKYNFKTLFGFLNGRVYVEPAELLLLEFPKEQLDFAFLLVAGKSKTINRRARNCARMILMKLFSEYLSCNDLFCFLESKEVYIQEKAKKLLRTLSTTELSFTFLCKKLKSNNVVVVRETQKFLIKHFAKRLGYKILFSFFEVGNGMCPGAAKLLDECSIEDVNINVLFGHLKSKNLHARKAALRMLLRCSKARFKYEVLISRMKSKNENVKDGVRLLLLKHFSDILEYRTLLSFLFSRNSTVINQTGKVLLKQFSGKLSTSALQRLTSLGSRTVSKEASQLFAKRYPNEVIRTDVDEKVVKQFTS